MEEGSRSRSLWSVERTRLNLDTIGMSSSPSSFFFFGPLPSQASIMALCYPFYFHFFSVLSFAFQILS